MKTLIELYDERPIENVLATEVFSPERTVFLCPGEVSDNKALKKKLNEYFIHRGIKTELVFVCASMYDSGRLLEQLLSLTEKYGDCMIDITGGTDAALFACGMLISEKNIPVFTFSRKNNCFFNINSAPFAEKLKCTVTHRIEDCFLMAGGDIRNGRVDNSVLYRYIDKIDAFFELYMQNRESWLKAVKYIQLASQSGQNDPSQLSVSASAVIKDERGRSCFAPREYLKALNEIGLTEKFSLNGETVTFRFADRTVRQWLRDAGSVLELYVYKCCLDAGIFNDVRTSVVVDWQGNGHGDVTNEIDVMATKGIKPLFISCKTCEIETPAINELSVLRDRFGGKSAGALIVTTKRCSNAARHRANELNIAISDIGDIKAGHLINNIISAAQR